jgi:hypothetical protein
MATQTVTGKELGAEPAFVDTREVLWRAGFERDLRLRQLQDAAERWWSQVRKRTDFDLAGLEKAVRKARGEGNEAEVARLIGVARKQLGPPELAVPQLSELLTPNRNPYGNLTPIYCGDVGEPPCDPPRIERAPESIATIDNYYILPPYQEDYAFGEGSNANRSTGRLNIAGHGLQHDVFERDASVRSNFTVAEGFSQIQVTAEIDLDQDYAYGYVLGGYAHAECIANLWVWYDGFVELKQESLRATTLVTVDSYFQHGYGAGHVTLTHTVQRDTTRRAACTVQAGFEGLIRCTGFPIGFQSEAWFGMRGYVRSIHIRLMR